MKILAAKIDWNEGYSNYANIRILVDKIPAFKDLRFEQRKDLYFAEKDGNVNFFSYKEPGQGYGGRSFEITMTDGSQKTLIGPWSSNSGSMNAAGFTPSVEATMTDSKEVWDKGFTFWGGQITEKKFKEALKFCPEAAYVKMTGGYSTPELSSEQGRVVSYGIKIPIGEDFSFVIVRKGMGVAQTQAYKNLNHNLKIIAELKEKVRQEKSNPRSRPVFGLDAAESLKAWVDRHNEDIKNNDLQKFGVKLVKA